MIINHNISALNNYRQMGINNNAGSKAMEKLSSGLRINRAGDDAAGLAISEKMRAQVRGLDQAGRNAQDGISMIQTAEGALQETHNILQRMRELANQAANDTNVEVDREEIQKEMNQLTSEINRIGNTTEFNTQKLLNGGGAEPTTSATSNGLTVPSSLSGGTGTSVTQASAAITFADTDAGTDYAGKSFKITIGDRELTVNTTMTDANSLTGGAAGQDDFKDPTVSTAGDTISLNVFYDSDDSGSAASYANATGTKVAAALKAELDRIIADDENLKNTYQTTAVAGALTVSAKTLDINSDGELIGAGGPAGNVAITNSTGTTALDADEQSAITNTAGSGTYASAEIDFTGKTIEDLVGTGIVIGDKKIDFYNSDDGEYSQDANGEADFYVDLRGAGNEEAIIDKIVAALHDGSGATKLTNNSGAESVYVTKSTSDRNVLQLTAVTAGITGNSITLQNNADVTVTNVDLPEEVKGIEITSASGLVDGEHQINITNVAASVTKGGIAGNATAADLTISIADDSDLASGTYQLVGTGTADTAKLQKLDSSGSWQDVAGYESIKMDNTENTYGDLTIKFDNATGGEFDATSDKISLTISANHYEATLTEAGGSAGQAVSFVNNQDGITLKSQDGVGQIKLDMGTVSGLGIGETANVRFDTSQASTTKEVSGGTFEASFQIGANSGQSMTISINDMRSQALKVSGTEAGGDVEAKNGKVASYVAVENVTNGTNNENVEFALDVSTHEKATAAISVINDSIETVSAQRSQLGAFQNRLEHTISNLANSSENLTAAESRIRDVDMAKEVMEMTRANILGQASQAMLAQANQKPQSVMQLLG